MTRSLVSACVTAAAPSVWDHYEILGVARDATAADITAAYERAISALPSHRVGRVLAQLLGYGRESFDKAFGTLIDPVQRSEYDEWIGQTERCIGWTPMA